MEGPGYGRTLGKSLNCSPQHSKPWFHAALLLLPRGTTLREMEHKCLTPLDTHVHMSCSEYSKDIVTVVLPGQGAQERLAWSSFLIRNKRG